MFNVARCVVGVVGSAFIVVSNQLVATKPGAQKFALHEVFELPDSQQVFAYSRISPDGRYLAYTTERKRRQPENVLQIVELSTRKVVFEEKGEDAYWSPDGKKFIFVSTLSASPSVTIVTLPAFSVSRDVAPADLGGYLSWGRDNGRDVIVTIKGNYYFLNGNRISGRPLRVPQCRDGASGERPLVSRDGKRITAFLDTTLIVRNIADCAEIIRTNVEGGKADFSPDGNLIAYHAWKPGGQGYEIEVADLNSKRLYRLSGLKGSSYYPSWTDKGQLLFRYEDINFRGFVVADKFVSGSGRPFPESAPQVSLDWSDIFPNETSPLGLRLVTIWSTWCAHSREALGAAESLQRDRHLGKIDFDVSIAADPTSGPSELVRLMSSNVHVGSLELLPRNYSRARAINQMPVSLLFNGRQFIARRLGAQPASELAEWVASATSKANSVD